MKIAIIGAGMSGCLAYNRLKSDGHDVEIFEKSRGVGGRISTRYIDEYKIDHGTPFFCAESEEFIEFCNNLVSENILRLEDNYYIPTSGINKICLYLTNKDDIITNTKIVKIYQVENKWILVDKLHNTYKGYDLVIIAIPAPQVLELDMTLNEYFKKQLKLVEYNSIATIIIHNKYLKFTKGILNFDTNIFKKVINNSLKYHYKDFESYIFHFNEIISSQISNKTQISQKLFMHIKSLFKGELPNCIIQQHFWKYALVKDSLKIKSYYDKDIKIGFIGDYMLGCDLEDAYLSAKDILSKIGDL